MTLVKGDMYQLNLNSGEKLLVESIGEVPVNVYYAAMNILNEQACTYGIVYTASPEAVDALRMV